MDILIYIKFVLLFILVDHKDLWIKKKHIYKN